MDVNDFTASRVQCGNIPNTQRDSLIGGKMVPGRFIVLLGVIAAAFMAVRDAGVSVAASDTVTPALVSIFRASASPVSPPGPVQLGFNATDAQNVARVVAIFQTPAGDSLPVSAFSNVTGVSAGSPASLNLTFNSLAQKDFSRLPAGVYTFQHIDISDWSIPQANELICNRDGSAVANPASSMLPASPCPSAVELQALDFEIENPAGDIDAPILVSVTLPTGQRTVGQSIQVSFTASDGTGAGLATIGVFYQNQANANQFIELSGSAAAASVQQTIPNNTPPGTYAISGIIVRDFLGYSLTYTSDGGLQKVPSGVSAPTPPHGIDLSATFTVINPNADTQTPVLNSFSRTSNAVVSPGNNVRLDFDATDNDDVQEIYFEFDAPAGLPLVVFDLTVNGNFVQEQVPLAAVPGLYSLSAVRVVDRDGNEVRYFRGGGTAGIPQGVTFPQAQPPGMAAMFAQADFTVGSGQGINLVSLSPKSALANSGQLFTLTVLGTGFAPTSVVHFGAANLATTFISSEELHAVVNPGLLNGSAQDVVVTVTTPFTLTSASSSRATSLVFQVLEFSSSDANCDGGVYLQDVVLFRHHLAGFAIPTACDDEAPGFLDADRSGAVNAADALYAMQVLAGFHPR